MYVDSFENDSYEAKLRFSTSGTWNFLVHTLLSRTTRISWDSEDMRTGHLVMAKARRPCCYPQQVEADVVRSMENCDLILGGGALPGSWLLLAKRGILRYDSHSHHPVKD